MIKASDVLLDHIAEHIARIEKTVGTITKEDFFQDVDIQDAIVRRLEIIGEAVRNLPPDLKAMHPDIPWQDIADMRNKLIHEYFEVDVELV
ncbi:MAG: HepT-like ribonuclease domain-containing protein [Patescibacteria group bacterium]